MTNEERDLITRFIERVGGTQAPGTSGPGAVAPLPPVDRDADALIAALFNRYPEARYRITQMAFVQEHALVEAQNRINRLQWELQQARQAQQAAPQGGTSPWGAAAAGAAAAQPQQPRGFFSNLFGGPAGPGAPPPQPQPQYSAAPPPPQYPQGYNPGMFQQQGPGFLGSALRTAAGVAGGVVAADALMGLFSGNHGGGGFGNTGFGNTGFGGIGGGFGGSGAEQASYASPWATPAGGVDPYDVGGVPKDQPGSDKFAGPADVDQSAWQPAPDQGGGGRQDASNQDASNQDPGGWQDASDSSGGDDGGGWTSDDNA